MACPVIHWEMWTKSPEKLGDFYKKVFGWKIDPRPELNYHIVDTRAKAGINGGMMTPQHKEPWPGNMSFYIDVDDLDAYRQKVQDAGGKILVEEQDVGGMGTFSLFADPDGRVIGLWKHCQK